MTKSVICILITILVYMAMMVVIGIVFSKKNNRLIGEWFRNYRINASIVYDKVEVFPHYQVDDAFNLVVPNRSLYLNNSELALSSKCIQDEIPEDAGFTLSAPWLMITFVICVLSFTLF